MESLGTISQGPWAPSPVDPSCSPREEALCFGWIDSTYRPLSSAAGMQRYTPRRKIGENYSQPNIERLAWLDRRKLIHPEVGSDATGGETMVKPW